MVCPLLLYHLYTGEGQCGQSITSTCTLILSWLLWFQPKSSRLLPWQPLIFLIKVIFLICNLISYVSFTTCTSSWLSSRLCFAIATVRLPDKIVLSPHLITNVIICQSSLCCHGNQSFYWSRVLTCISNSSHVS